MNTPTAVAVLESEATSSRFSVVTYVTTYGQFLGLPIYSTIATTIPVTPSATSTRISATSTRSSTTITSTTSPTCRRCSYVPVQTSAHDPLTSTAGAGVADPDVRAGTMSHHHDGISKGALAAAIVVPLLALLAILAGLFFCCRRRKQRRTKPVGVDDGPTREMADAGPPTLNHIVPGVAAAETSDCPETPRSRRFFRHPHRASSSNPPKSAPAAPRGTTPTQRAANKLAPIVAVNGPTTDPFATPTSGTTAYNSPEDGPRYLAGAANDSTPSRTSESNQERRVKPEAGAVGRHWHSTHGTSRPSRGRDARPKQDVESRPESAQGTISDLGSDDEVEIGQATVALGHGQRASVIDMSSGGHNGSPPKASPL